LSQNSPNRLNNVLISPHSWHSSHYPNLFQFSIPNYSGHSLSRSERVPFFAFSGHQKLCPLDLFNNHHQLSPESFSTSRVIPCMELVLALSNEITPVPVALDAAPSSSCRPLAQCRPRSRNDRQCWCEGESKEAEYEVFRSGSALGGTRSISV
jgi:hypothetical protein